MLKFVSGSWSSESGVVDLVSDSETDCFDGATVHQFPGCEYETLDYINDDGLGEYYSRISARSKDSIPSVDSTNDFDDHNSRSSGITTQSDAAVSSKGCGKKCTSASRSVTEVAAIFDERFFDDEKFADYLKDTFQCMNSAELSSLPQASKDDNDRFLYLTALSATKFTIRWIYQPLKVKDTSQLQSNQATIAVDDPPRFASIAVINVKDAVGFIALLLQSKDGQDFKAMHEQIEEWRKSLVVRDSCPADVRLVLAMSRSEIDRAINKAQREVIKVIIPSLHLTLSLSGRVVVNRYPTCSIAQSLTSHMKWM